MQLWPDLPALESFELNREIYEIDRRAYKATLDVITSYSIHYTKLYDVPREESFCALLEAGLNDGLDRRRFDVICGGIPGYNSADQLGFYRHFAEQ